ncbi:type II toxin-antitoxin system prevent-host-death family antitoxin [Chitinibacter sp. S2-10]|uniref:type II toxin-antitoxin system prevent-host-death family antitoxin n=1 Tax=Chitinibacter sp. S2-10 TaxID=3373597 RepID=UPI00397762DD
MEAMTYSYTRQHLADVLNKVNEDRSPILITRQTGEPAVLMSLTEYNAIEETAHLLRSPANAQRLLQAIAEHRQGAGEIHELIDAD